MNLFFSLPEFPSSRRLEYFQYSVQYLDFSARFPVNSFLLIFDEFDYPGLFSLIITSVKIVNNANHSKPLLLKVDDVVDEVRGLPRPEDYDDFWYEGEDGLWYNEYDDGLEEGQWYEELDETEGYPKPDLSEVPQDEFEVEAEAETEEIPDLPAPAAPIKPSVDQAEIQAAKEAAKATQDAAKNILGGAMSLGGGLLGGMGAKQPQKPQQSQQPQQKPGQQSQQQSGLGGMLGGLMGAAKPQQQQNQQQKPKPPPQQQQQQKPPTSQTSQQQQKPAGPEEPCKPQATEKSESEKMEKEEKRERGVTFEDEVVEKKEREERQVNKTRTMRPKEKWEWAFNRILKNIEVRRRPSCLNSRT